MDKYIEEVNSNLPKLLLNKTKGAALVNVVFYMNIALCNIKDEEDLIKFNNIVLKCNEIADKIKSQNLMRLCGEWLQESKFMLHATNSFANDALLESKNQLIYEKLNRFLRKTSSTLETFDTSNLISYDIIEGQIKQLKEIIMKYGESLLTKEQLASLLKKIKNQELDLEVLNGDIENSLVGKGSKRAI